MTQKPRSRLLYGGVALVTAVLGYGCRFGHLGLPLFVIKYGGSALWAAMIYWLIAVALPRAAIRTLALTTGVIATAIELLKLVYTPTLDTFRLTFAGKVILGRHFSVRDLVAYYVAIAAAALLDGLLQNAG